MLNKAANAALRITWETVALFSGLLLGAVPMILIAAALAWAVSDPGCSCYSGLFGGCHCRNRMLAAVATIQIHCARFAGCIVLPGRVRRRLFCRRRHFEGRHLAGAPAQNSVRDACSGLGAARIRGAVLYRALFLPLENALPVH
jgi:hypothetical protein